ncbi:uncharacterized protein EV422DRAFT_501243, partial [Fimicolochytrium jonesii]|uniref:uncharacterized protein n=1 Tax=Fimicolochytrium jonesii TaxID=1396493 RepID=UPI0022FEDF26
PNILNCDDASGNRSKKWNCHFNWCCQLAGLPFKQGSRDYNVHFLVTSNRTAPLETGGAIVNDIVSGVEQGIDAFDATMMEPVLAGGVVFCMEADNPMANELCSMIDVKRG